MAKVTIIRRGVKPDAALKVAKLLVALAGEDEVSIVLHGPWQTRQGCTPLADPVISGALSWDGMNLAVHRGRNETAAVRPTSPECTVDITARIERVKEG